ncbi:uncharacterized protein KY384_003365 [Bacidia gigantensis]|uniref:uncharacterized protein n=1 Tax=Bacidia gigantensis TaxID=2732470 RepID=UPI001D059201|nr:uncharacterized protein KY384_003365 [Bacidia gigantensis]KAG8531733.1 hypothetical protein KY384_003365 [Bacidia gigantensis]
MQRFLSDAEATFPARLGPGGRNAVADFDHGGDSSCLTTHGEDLVFECEPHEDEHNSLHEYMSSFKTPRRTGKGRARHETGMEADGKHLDEADAEMNLEGIGALFDDHHNDEKAKLAAKRYVRATKGRRSGFPHSQEDQLLNSDKRRIARHLRRAIKDMEDVTDTLKMVADIVNN